MEFLLALNQYEFLQTAVLAGVLASIGCGITGTYVVTKRIAFLAGGIAHSVLGGMGMALYFGWHPMLGALLAAVLVALLIGWIRLHWRTQEDTLISAIWAIGMAIGIIFIAKTPGYQTNLMSYLFGDILLVSRESLWLMVILDIVLILTVAAFHRQFLAVVFDEEFARLRGVPVSFFYLLLLVLVAVTVVLLIQVVGLILVLALLTLPATVAQHYLTGLGAMMLVASLLGMLLTLAGIGLAYTPDLPVGPTIILLAGMVYLCSTLLSRAVSQHRANRAIRSSQASDSV